MSHVSRRSLLIGSFATAGTAVVAGWAAPAAAGRSRPSPAASPTEQAVRDAAMVWRRAPRDCQDGPFLGNGRLGAQVYCGPSGNTLSFALSQCDGRRTPLGVWREPVDVLSLSLSGTITAVDWVLNLWDAELSGTVTTTRGAVAFTSVVHITDGALLVWTSASAGERRARWTGGGDHTIAWQERRLGDRRLLAATEAGSAIDPRRALARATGVIDPAHRRWWHEHYAHSFVSVPDRSVQRFYWAQLYKLGALGGAGGPATAGWRAWPAELGDGWAGAWRRLAARAAGPLLDAAMADLDPPGAHLLDAALPGMGSKAGRLASPLASLHNLWYCQRHSMNARLEREVLRPLLHRAVERYRPFLALGGDGRWHLPSSYSPGCPDATDSTYHLALLRWGATALGRTDLLGRLAPYHQDASGVLIGARTQLRRSRPYPSHLWWIHPLRESGWDEPARRRLRRLSFDTWAARRDGWQAHSYAAAASMAAVLGDGAAALQHLCSALGGKPMAGAAVRANTLYHQRGVAGLESPFALAEAMLDMVLDGAGGAVKIFPAASPAWSEVSFAGLRVPGGFVVDADRAAGRTQWVRVHAQAGGDVTLRHGITGEIGVRDERGRAIPWTTADGALSFTLPAGRTAIVSSAGELPDTQPRQVAEDGTGRVWGLPA